MSTPPPAGYRVLAGLIGVAQRLAGWRVDAHGLGHVPRTGGAVVTWNHVGHVDMVATALPLLRRTGRWVRFLALRDLWDRGLLGLPLRLAQCIPVERGSEAGRQAAFDDAVDALRAGDLVMAAPEGRISTSGELLPFLDGPARMAQEAGVPLVPTASWGTQRFSTTGRSPSLRAAWRLPVTVRVGAPLPVGPDDDPTVVTEELRRRTAELLTAARADHPGPT